MCGMQINLWQNCSQQVFSKLYKMGFFILSINIRKLYLCTPEVLLTVNCKCYCHYMYISKLNAYIKSFRIKIISSNIIFLSFYLYSHCVVFLSGINAISFKVILYLTTSFFPLTITPYLMITPSGACWPFIIKFIQLYQLDLYIN